MRSRRVAVAGLVVTAVAFGTMTVGAAQAKNAQVVPTPQQQAKVFERMLTVEDVPRRLLVDPGTEYTMKAHGGQHQALCDKNGKDIQGRETNLLYQIELGETNTIADPVAIEQKVWPYGSTQQALREWQYIEQQVQLCTGRSDWRGDTGNRNVQYLSNGRTEYVVDGRTGIWIWIDARRGSFNVESEDGGYYVLYLVKDVIMSVEYDYPDAKGLPFATRQLVDRLTFQLAQRWLDTY